MSHKLLKNYTNLPITNQASGLIKVVLKNPNIKRILNANLFPDTTQWYLGAACLCQSVWNYLSSKEITQGIKDYDLIYYDAKDISKETEMKVQKRVKALFASLPVEIEVINEARVHLWFEEYAGKKIAQYQSCEDAINTWPTTATCVGINKIKSKFNVYTPYGLNDLFSMIVRPNKLQVSQQIYEAKVQKWTKSWPNLEVISWSEK